jgi:uncharacterized membrane protein YkvA (DUF1232 family)
MKKYSQGVAVDQLDYEQGFQYVADNLERKFTLLSKKFWIVREAIALYRYMTDPSVHWIKKVLVVSALIYFIMPVDVILDFTPIKGYTDEQR